MDIYISCPNCSSSTLRKHTERKLKCSKKPNKVYRCVDCRKIFTPDDGYLRRRYSKILIERTVELYIQKNPKVKIIRKIEEEFNKKISRPTLDKWIKKYYKNMANKFAKILYDDDDSTEFE